MLVAYAVAGVGVLVLVVVLLTVRPRLRRVTRALEEMRAGLERGRTALPAVNSLRPGRERRGTGSSGAGPPEGAA